MLERETWHQQGEEEGACLRQTESPTVLAARIQKWLMDEQQRRRELEEADRRLNDSDESTEKIKGKGPNIAKRET